MFFACFYLAAIRLKVCLIESCATFLVIMGANQSSSPNQSPTDDVIQYFGWRSSIFFK